MKWRNLSLLKHYLIDIDKVQKKLLLAIMQCRMRQTNK